MEIPEKELQAMQRALNIRAAECYIYRTQLVIEGRKDILQRCDKRAEKEFEPIEKGAPFAAVLYAAMHNPCIHESADATLSIHLTKEGAESALNEHKEERRKRWQQLVDRDEDKGTDWSYEKMVPFGCFESWRIQEIEIQF